MMSNLIHALLLHGEGELLSPQVALDDASQCVVESKAG